MSEQMKGFMCGMVVLSASQRVPLPVVSSSQASFRDHLPGVVFQGRSGTMSEHQEADPGTTRCLYSNRPLAYGKQALANLGSSRDDDQGASFRSQVTSRLEGLSSPGDVVVLDQQQPVGMVVLHSNEGGLRLFGVHSDNCSLLMWSNSPDVDALVNSAGSKTWKLFRFKERSTFTAPVFTMRVCARWHRWSKSNLASEQKFLALEASMFNP